MIFSIPIIKSSPIVFKKRCVCTKVRKQDLSIKFQNQLPAICKKKPSKKLDGSHNLYFKKNYNPISVFTFNLETMSFGIPFLLSKIPVDLNCTYGLET